MLPELLYDLGFPGRNPLTSRWHEVQGKPMHSRFAPGCENGGLPIVFVHGLVISSLYMIPLAAELAAQSPVHALDLPGFGRSAAPAEILSIPQLAEAVSAWLAAAQIARCHLVANSLGCEVAAHVAQREPGSIATLTLIGPTIDPHAHAFVVQFFRLLRDAFREPARLWLNWAFDFFRAGPRRTWGTTRAMFRDHIEDQLPRIQTPTLVLRGSRDPTVPQSAAECMTRLLPHGTLRVILGEPHCAHYTRPALVAAAILELIAHADTFPAQDSPDVPGSP